MLDDLLLPEVLLLLYTYVHRHLFTPELLTKCDSICFAVPFRALVSARRAYEVSSTQRLTT